MKYLKKYSNYINENVSINFIYFKKILKEFVSSTDELIEKKDEIISKMIDRAKYNLDSNPSDKKIQDWNEEIKEVIDRYIETNGKFTPKKGDYNYDDPIKQKNNDTIKSLLKQGSFLYNEIMDIPNYYVKEVGYEVIIKYLKKEEQIQFFKPNKLINVEKYPGEDEIHYILRKHNIEGDWKLVKDRLIHYFIKRLAANIPDDKVLNEDEATKFVNTYIEKFLHLYLVPMSKI